MALIFQLWLEGRDQYGNERLADYFDGMEMAVMGRRIGWAAELTDRLGVPGVAVWSPDLSRFGVRTIHDALETTEAGLRLHHRLLGAPDFRFARVDWEAENIPAIDVSEYVELDMQGERHLDLQCVMDNEFFQQLGHPVAFRSFRDGYLWRPYLGETYRPLYSQDQVALNNVCQELFPDYFRQ